MDTETQHDDGNEYNDERDLENDSVEDNVSTPDDIMPNLPYSPKFFFCEN